MDVLQPFYSNFISFLGTNLLTQCQLLFFACFYIAVNQYQTKSKHRETFCGFFMDQRTTSGPKKHLGGAPRGHNPPGRAWGLRRAPVGCATSLASCTPSSPYKSSNIPKTLGVTLNQKLRYCKPLQPSKTNLDPIPALRRSGKSSPVAIFIIPTATTMRRE